MDCDKNEEAYRCCVAEGASFHTRCCSSDVMVTGTDLEKDNIGVVVGDKLGLESIGI